MPRALGDKASSQSAVAGTSEERGVHQWLWLLGATRDHRVVAPINSPTAGENPPLVFDSGEGIFFAKTFFAFHTAACRHYTSVALFVGPSGHSNPSDPQTAPHRRLEPLLFPPPLFRRSLFPPALFILTTQSCTTAIGESDVNVLGSRLQLIAYRRLSKAVRCASVKRSKCRSLTAQVIAVE